MDVELGSVIASRTLERDGREFRVLVGEPQRMGGDEPDFICPFYIEGPGESKVRYAAGVDSVQALILALTLIGQILKAETATITFLGQPELWFPPVQRPDTSDG